MLNCSYDDVLSDWAIPADGTAAGLWSSVFCASSSAAEVHSRSANRLSRQETSDHPVQDARQVYPAEKGESYYYVRDKYWRVEKVLQDGWIVARTALMEQYYLRRNDPNLRKASLLERLKYASRFPYA